MYDVIELGLAINSIALSVSDDDLKMIKGWLETIEKGISELVDENHNLKEQLKNCVVVNLVGNNNKYIENVGVLNLQRSGK